MPVYDRTYIKIKLENLTVWLKQTFLGDEIQKEHMHYTCIACITIDSVMKSEKKNYTQIYLEECKKEVKKKQMSRFITPELESDSESESKSDTKLMTRLESGSDSE